MDRIKTEKSEIRRSASGSQERVSFQRPLTTDFHIMHPDESSASGSPHTQSSKTRGPTRPATAVDAHGRTHLAKACSRGEYDNVKKWLSIHPKDLNFPDHRGNTPLQIAAMNGYDNIVKLLIDTGCDINCINHDKDTPLLDAIDNGHLGVIKVLLEAGVDPRKGNVNSEEPLLDRVNHELENCDEIRAALMEARQKHGDHQRTSEEQQYDSSRRSHAPVDEVEGETDLISWGSLLSVDLSRWPGLILANRPGNLPACKPQGYILGRDSECDLVIDDPYVSNRHCLIYRVVRKGQISVFLRDLSSNGTFVNNAIIGCNQVRMLKDRDEIMIVDSVRFIFRQHGSTHQTFLQQYTLLEQIGKGNVGEVFMCAEKSTGKRFAVKIHTFSAVPYPNLNKEVDIAAELNLMGLCHKNIIFMKEAFREKHASFHVTQIAEKGELFNLIVLKSKLSEGETRHIFKQLFDAVKYLHDRNIVHRDLKPENVLVLDEDHSVALCSFDRSITITSKSFDSTLIGVPSYVAPEILADSKHRKYGREVDIWSLGVILYICLCGFPPFSDELYSKEFPYNLSQQIKSGRFDYPSPYWDSVGDPALDLIDSMLVVDPKKRFTIEQCLAHPWLTQAVPGQEESAKSAPVLRRQPTMLGSSQVMPSPTYDASEAKGKGKIPSPLIKQPETKKQDHPMHQNVYDEARGDTTHTKMIGEIGDDLEKLTLDKNSEKPQKDILAQALKKANIAVRLDNAKDFQGARSAYREACDLLHQVVLHTKKREDKEKLGVIAKTYDKRIEELSHVLLSNVPTEAQAEGHDHNEQRAREVTQGRLVQGHIVPDDFPSPAALAADTIVHGKEEGGKSAAMTPQDDRKPSTFQSTVEELAGPESQAKSPARNCSDPSLALEYDPFAWLVNSVINKPITPRTLSTQLPEDLQNDIEFNDRGQGLSTFTCTPSASIPSDEIPLRIDGHPVILPVEYKYPLTGMFSPPPDPHPLFISPYSQLSEEDIHHILATFPACVGFYLLVNGFLQVIMPDDFDYEEGVPNFPTEFGGLKVSLVPETVCPTAGEASASNPTTTTTSTRTRFERMFGQSSAQSSVAGSAGRPSTDAAGISVGSTIRAIVPGSKSKQRFEGKIGVVITPRDEISKKYITIPTHLLTDAVIASKTMSLDSDTWRKDVKVCAASTSAELGEIATVFDQDPKSFPIGFSHDVSLVDISGIPDTPRMIAYAADLTWLSQQEWMDIKYNSSNLVLLDDRSREAKSIGVVDSRCQMVGQGIFRIQQQSRKRSSFLGSLSSGSSSSRAQDPRDDPSTWTTLVARSILYRVQPDYPARGGQSGVPVCVVSESTDGTTPRSVKVAGFASFVQMVSDVQKYDLEGDKLYKRLQEGRVAFYGAFQVPQDLRDGYQIL